MPNNPHNTTNSPYLRLHEKNYKESSSSTTNEKMFMVELQYQPGDVIRYVDSDGKIQHVIKIGEGEYVDAQTRNPRNIRNIIGSLEKSGHKVSFGEMSREEVLSSLTSRMNNWEKNRAMIDIETVIKERGTQWKPEEIYSMATVGKNPGLNGTNPRVVGKEFLFTDAMEMAIISGDDSYIKGMNGPTSEMFLKMYKRWSGSFYQDTPNPLSNVKNLTELVNNTQYRDIVDKLHNKSTRFTYNIGPDDKDLSNLYKMSNKAYGKLPAEFSLEIGTAQSLLSSTRGNVSPYEAHLRQMGSSTSDIQFMSANPSGIDQPVYDFLSEKYMGSTGSPSMIDLRGNQMLINSHLFPGMTDNLSQTFGPQLDEISNRLRMSDKERSLLFQRFNKGFSSVYQSSTATEDMLSELRYTMNTTDKVEFSKTLHSAMVDNLNQLDLVNHQEAMLKRSVNEIMYPEMRIGGSTRSRYIAGRAQSIAVSAMMDANEVYGPRDKAYLHDMFNRKVNINKLKNEITQVMETTTSQRIERSFFKDTMKELGGSTIGHVLAGSFLLVGIRAASMKAMELFASDKNNSTEGISNESITTNLRRLQTTDFGSGRFGGNPVSTMITLGTSLLSRAFKNSPTRNHISNTLKNINTAYKSTGGIKNMLNNNRERISFIRKIFGSNTTMGEIRNLTENLRQEGILGETASDFINNNIRQVRNAVTIAGEVGSSFTRKGSRKILDDSLSSMFFTETINKGQTVKTLRKAPIIGASAGLGAAWLIMSSRGKYSQEEMERALPSSLENKYHRQYTNTRNIAQRIRDIRNTQLEGMGLGSPERQYGRYTQTDFGSGISKLYGTYNTTMTAIRKVLNSKLERLTNMTTRQITSKGLGKEVSDNMVDNAAGKLNTKSNVVTKTSRSRKHVVPEIPNDERVIRNKAIQDGKSKVHNVQKTDKDIPQLGFDNRNNPQVDYDIPKRKARPKQIPNMKNGNDRVNVPIDVHNTHKYRNISTYNQVVQGRNNKYIPVYKPVTPETYLNKQPIPTQQGIPDRSMSQVNYPKKMPRDKEVIQSRISSIQYGLMGKPKKDMRQSRSIPFI